MRYFKLIMDGYVIGIGTGLDGDEITEQEHMEIYAVIEARPEPPEGFYYQLKSDLTWEPYAISQTPEVEEPAPENTITDLESEIDEIVTILEGIA